MKESHREVNGKWVVLERSVMKESHREVNGVVLERSVMKCRIT